MISSSSARVVYAALAGDLAVAAAKFGASALSGSSAMLTEAIHSLVDSADQILLLTGQFRARKPPDRTHPFGYGMETYFWSFVVALFVFFLGGLVAVYQGTRHLLRSPCQNLDFREGRNLGEFGRTLSERKDLIGKCL